MGHSLDIVHSPGAVISGRDILIDMSFRANWNEIGDYGQYQTNWNTQHENKSHVDWDYKISMKVLFSKEGILHKSENKYQHDPWTISTLHTNGTIRVQQGTKSE